MTGVTRRRSINLPSTCLSALTSGALPLTPPSGILILMPSARLLRECDELARSLGPTPKFNAQGLPEPIGMPELKYAIYVVWIGRAIGLFHNWLVPQTQLHGY